MASAATLRARAWLVAVALGTASLLATGCAYDNEEEVFGPAGTECDTATATYAGTIAPLLQAHCHSCHRAGFTEGGVATDTYQDVQLLARTNQLMGVVAHAPGYPAMPRDAPRLPDCDIEKIRQWVAAGYPNN